MEGFGVDESAKHGRVGNTYQLLTDPCFFFLSEYNVFNRLEYVKTILILVIAQSQTINLVNSIFD